MEKHSNVVKGEEEFWNDVCVMFDVEEECDDNVSEESNNSLVVVDMASLFNSAMDSQLSYRQLAISRWKAKRKRRSFKKKKISAGRSDVAKGRVRVGGRFTSTSDKFVPVSSISHTV